jgi:glycosyltransferase involved in cell wall biosynthesis
LSKDAAAALHASERAALACAHHVIATSAVTAQLLAADYDVASERLSVVEPGTDRVKIAPRKSGAEVALLAVGAVVPRKGYDVLVAALATIKQLSWRLVIAGDCARSPGTMRELEGDILRLGLAGRVTFSGALAKSELDVLYASADLFVLPSRFEGYGMAYAEAMSHGLPVVATTAGAIPQTVPAGAGALVPPDDAEALAAALRRLIEAPHERERLAAAARSVRFPTWRRQAALFAGVLERFA